MTAGEQDLGAPTGWRVGAKVGRLVLERKLGAGGMGVVWLAQDPESDARYAIKTLVADADPELCLRFLRESEAQARVDRHPNVVRVHSMDRAYGRLYIVLDYVSGQDLEQRLRAGPLGIEEAASIVRDLALGMEHVHRQGVLHRDLKPANVLFDEEGTPKLVDFGLAQLTSGAEALTRTGDLLGTPAFMAPEQALGARDRIGPPTDVYGLGAILYQCLTGQAPYDGGSTLVVLAAVTSDEPPAAPRSLRREIPASLERIVLRALHKDPAQRPESARALADQLEAFLRGEVAAPGARGLRLVGAVTVVIALCAGALLLSPALVPDPTPQGAVLSLPGTEPAAEEPAIRSRPLPVKEERLRARRIEDAGLRGRLAAALASRTTPAELLAELTYRINDAERRRTQHKEALLQARGPELVTQIAELEARRMVDEDVLNCLEALAERSPSDAETRYAHLRVLKLLTRIRGAGLLERKLAYASAVHDLGGRPKERRDAFYEVGYAFAQRTNREALRWLERGGEEGDDRSLVVLGNIYFNGTWVERDLGKAIDCYERAIRAADPPRPDALLGVGESLLDQGDASQRERALSQLEGVARGSSAHRERAMRRLWRELQNAELQKILPWLRPAVEDGVVTDPDARWKLGCALRDGEHLPQDLSAAARWIGLAAESGEHDWAGIDYGRLFEEGKGVEANGHTAREWYERALTRNRFANTALGHLYEHGAPGLAVDLVRARVFHEKGAEAEDEWSIVSFTRFLRLGIGGAKDEARAARLLRRACVRYPAFDLYSLHLAQLLAERPDLALDPGEARRCLERSAALGSKAAQELLEKREQ